jgi:hypothetical protein
VTPRLYLVADKVEIDRRRRLARGPAVVEVWQDLYTPDVLWLADDETRRHAYARPAERPPGGLFWMGEASRAALDGLGDPLPLVLSVPAHAVPIYYGPLLADLESLPTEESLRARVLSAHGVAVVWATYHPSGARNEFQPAAPTDPTFHLRRPRGFVVHLWRLFRTRREATLHVAEHMTGDPEAARWAEGLPAEDFSDLVERFGQPG